MKQSKGLEGIELNQLTDEELRNNILEVNKEQLAKIANMSYQFFISKSVLIIKTIGDKDFLYEIDEEEEKKVIFKGFHYIINLFKRLNDEESKIDAEHEMNILLDIRKKCHDLSEALYGYEIESSYMKELLDYHTIKKVEKEEYKYVNIDRTEVHLLLNRVKNILSSQTIDHLTYVDIVSNILGILPFRMIKSKYFDVLHTTMIRNLNYYSVAIVENQIEEYKKIFDSSLHGNYGIIFDKYFTDIQRFKNTSIKSLSLDELEDMATDVIDLSTDIRGIRSIIIDIGTLINRLIVIVLNRDKISLNYKDEVLLAFKDWEDRIDEELLYSLLEKSKTELQNIEKELLKDVEKLKTFNDEMLKRENFFDKDLNQEMLYTRDILTYYNDLEFTKHEVLFPEKEERITDDYLEQLINSLIHYIDRSIIAMGGIERKIRMRRLLSVLELPFQNIEQFLSYIEYSLDERIVSKGEILFTIDALNYWLDTLEE